MATAGEVGGSQFSHRIGSEDFYDQGCQPCQLDGKLQEAVGLCTDCQEYLCQRCFDAHTLPTPMRNHELLDKKQMVQRQVSLKKEDKCSEKCAVHEDKVIEYYCIDHCHLGCSVCITLDHRSCDNVRYIPHVARGLANNEEYEQAENQFESMMIRSKKVIEVYKQKAESTQKTCSEAVKTVQEFRKDIHETLDKIEADLVNECETMKTEELEKMAQIVEKYKAAQRDLEELQTMKETYQNNKQNCNLYIAMMKAKDKLTLAEERLREAEKEQSSIRSQIKFVPNKETLNTLKSFESFGKLSKSGAASIVIPEQTRTSVRQTETTADVKSSEPGMTVRCTEAQTAVKRCEPRTIVGAQHVQDINVNSSIDKKICNITGLAVLPNNRFLVIDGIDVHGFDIGNGNIKLVEQSTSSWWKKWKVITHLTLTSSPYDVAMATNSQVAVTYPYAKKVAMINVSATAMTVDRTLDMNGICWGVDYRYGKLAVTFKHPSRVQVFTLEGRVLYTITKDKQGQDLFRDPQYVVFCLDNTSLYVSDLGSKRVVQVKFDGTVVGSYTDRELRGPSGLLTDSSGNVFVCGEYSNNIHQITADCRKIQVLLTRSIGSCLDWPRSISYSEAECRFYVGMVNKNVVKEYGVTLSSK